MNGFSNNRLRFILALELMLCALFFAWMSGRTYVAAVNAVLAAAVLIRREPLRLNARNLFYICLTAGILTVAGNYFFPVKINRFGFFAILFQTEYYNPLLLYASILLLLFDRPFVSLGAATVTLFFTLCSAGDLIDFNRDDTFLPWSPSIMAGHYTLIYTICAVIGILMLFLAAGAVRRRGGPVAVKLLIIFIVLPLLWKGGWDLYLLHEKDLRKLESFVMSRAAALARKTASDGKPVSVDISSGVPDDGPDTEEIVIRAEGARPPGYLRGRAYSSYSAGRWSESAAPLHDLAPEEIPGISAARYRNGTDGGKPVIVWRFDAAGSSELPVLFLPGSWCEIEVVASGVKATRDGTVIPDKMLISGGWRTAGRIPADGNTACQSPESPDPGLLECPPELSGVLDATLMRISGFPEASSDAERQRKIAEFLLNNYTYRVRRERTEGEPVADFLTRDNSGHCEFFASAATLLARRAGMAARYVTGFVCEEKAPFGEYYVARRSTAHAWAEVYDRDRRSWTLLETTPPDGQPCGKSTWTFYAGIKDNVQRLWRKLFAALRRGEAAETIKKAAASPWPWVVIVLISGIVVYRRFSRAVERRIETPLPEIKRHWRAEARRRIKRCVRRGLVSNPDSITLPEIAARVKASAAFSEVEKTEFLRFAAEYESARWRP